MKKSLGEGGGGGGDKMNLFICYESCFFYSVNVSAVDGFILGL